MAKVGITCLKLNNGYGRGKKKGNLKAVSCEALEERQCSDEDYDPSKTCYNYYEGITSGEELTRVITEEAEEYSRKQKAKGKRALRKDAITGYAVIVKPEGEFISGLTPEEEERFWNDSNSIMRDILGEQTIKSRVRHVDEAYNHEHYFGMPYVVDKKTGETKLCGKEFFSLKMYKRFNSEYPKRMREMGWDIDECVVYDEEQAETDEGYKERHIKSKKEKGYGLTATKFKEKKKNEEIAKKDEKISSLEDENKEKDEKIADLEQANKWLEEDIEVVRNHSIERANKINELEDENKKKDEEIKRLKSMIYSNTNSNSRYARANALTSNIDYGNNSNSMQR